jgi:hypothetical protein
VNSSGRPFSVININTEIEMAPVKRPPLQQQHRVYFREWREFARPDLSQADVARLIGADHSSVQRLEAGKNPYTQWWLESLAVVYRCERGI